jgi:hypothetical protein
MRRVLVNPFERAQRESESAPPVLARNRRRRSLARSL